MSNGIGSYFELELNKGGLYHSEALGLNTGRNSIEYILRSRGYKKALLPGYCCTSILEPFKKLGIEYRFYGLAVDLTPETTAPPDIDGEECFLVINYFGLMEKQTEAISRQWRNVILDNTRAFFS